VSFPDSGHNRDSARPQHGDIVQRRRILPHLGVHRGAITTGARDLASTVLPRRSSTTPAASLAIVLAVAGRHDEVRRPADGPHGAPQRHTLS
jgi:hypothetical protein